jgi:hypothetical protein
MSNDYVLSDISLEGYQIVRTAYFEKYVEPVMTLFNTSIGFGMGCYTALGNCEFIQLMLNDSNHTILIKPINSKENEALSWRRSAQNVKYHKMDCAMFSRKLFERWGLNPKCHYRAIGSLVQCDKKLMLLFDFSDCRVYHGLKVVNEEK